MSQPHPEGRDPRVGELHLLGEVTWHGAPVHGGRTHALLASLVDAAGRTVGERALVDDVWARIAGGCHPNRDAVGALTSAGFDVSFVRRFGFSPQRGIPATAHVLGRARRSR